MSDMRTEEISNEQLEAFITKRQEQVEKRRVRGKKWRDANPEKVKASGKAYRDRKAAVDKTMMAEAEKRGLIG